MRNIIWILTMITMISLTASINTMTFDEFIVKFNKTYQKGSEQYEQKKIVFNQNIVKLNAMDCSVCGVTKFFDVSSDSFDKKILNLKLLKNQTSDKIPLKASKLGKVGAPNAIDWRQSGIITSVKSQGDCGACWAFVVAAMSQSSLILKHEATQSIDLSEQFLVQCTKDSTCAGGFIEYAIDTAIFRGLPKQSKYPYQPFTTHPGICWSIINTRISNKPRRSYYAISNNEIKDLLTIGPLAIAISSKWWEYYIGGVWRCRPNDQIDHAVLLVGYANDAWIIKNQWGENWGENGYIRVSMNPGENCGVGSGVHMLDQKHNQCILLILISIFFIMLF